MLQSMGSQRVEHNLVTEQQQRQNKKSFYFLKGSLLAASDLSCSKLGPSSGHAGSFVVVRGISCSQAYGILVPRPGIEPAFPALQGGLVTTGPPGKSPVLNIL